MECPPTSLASGGPSWGSPYWPPRRAIGNCQADAPHGVSGERAHKRCIQKHSGQIEGQGRACASCASCVSCVCAHARTPARLCAFRNGSQSRRTGSIATARNRQRSGTQSQRLSQAQRNAIATARTRTGSQSQRPAGALASATDRKRLHFRGHESPHESFRGRGRSGRPRPMISRPKPSTATRATRRRVPALRAARQLWRPVHGQEAVLLLLAQIPDRRVHGPHALHAALTLAVVCS